MELENRKQDQSFELAERLRNEKDPAVANCIGDDLGQMVFGDGGWQDELNA
jgi:hypothetical protein